MNGPIRHTEGMAVLENISTGGYGVVGIWWRRENVVTSASSPQELDEVRMPRLL
jgi:hypothetical protein